MVSPTPGPRTQHPSVFVAEALQSPSYSNPSVRLSSAGWGHGDLEGQIKVVFHWRWHRPSLQKGGKYFTCPPTPMLPLLHSQLHSSLPSQVLDKSL